jgi:hypothetical protein
MRRTWPIWHLGQSGRNGRKSVSPKFAAGCWGQQIATDSMQQLAAEGEFLLAETIGQETKVTDALGAGR